MTRRRIKKDIKGTVILSSMGPNSECFVSGATGVENQHTPYLFRLR